MVDSALKRLANMHNPGNWIIAAIEGAQYSSGEGRHDPGWFHPSALGNECDAFLAFRFLGAPAKQVIEARTQRIFDYGNEREGYLREYVVTAGINIITDPKDRYIEIPDLRIKGELDEWVINPITKEKYIVDYKTMRSGLWKELTQVTRGHHLQLHPYQFAKETYKGFVLYENKDTQELKAMKADFNNNIWQTDIVDRINRILSKLKIDLVDRNPINCSRCPFFANGVCTSNKIAELKESSGLKF